MLTEYCVSEINKIPIEELPKDFFYYFSKKYYSFGKCYWWAYRDKEGTLIAICGLDLYSDEGGFLCLSWVDPKFRGQGFQKKMIRIRERKARVLGCNRLVSYTLIDNCPSGNNLIDCGYKTYIPDENWGQKNVNYWYKSI